MYIVALTGGIGSGKSTIANIFLNLGVTVVDTDVIAKHLVKSRTTYLRDIIFYFGKNIVNHDGSLNRRLLREQIFSSPNKKKWLEALLHPAIYQETKNQIAKATTPYVLWVVPLLVENQLYKQVNRVLVIDTKPEIQIYRTIIRDKVSNSHVKQILLAQIDREARLAVADDIIANNSKIEDILSDILSLHMRYLTLANQIK